MTQSSFLTGHDASSLTHFLSLFNSLCLFVSVRTRVCTSVSVQPSRERKKKARAKSDDGFVLRASILLCVFSRSLSVLFFFVFLSGPVLGQADQSGRFLPWSVSHLPVSRLMTNGSKINTIRKESLQLSNCSYTHPHTLSPCICVYISA